MQNPFLKVCIGFAVLFSVMFTVSCATTGPPFFAEKAHFPGFCPAGSTWGYERRDSGSFGSGTVQTASKSLGEQTWQGRKVYAYEGRESTLLLEASSSRFVAFVKGTTPLMSWDPPIGFDYPLWVGKKWTTTHSLTNHPTNKTSTVEVRWNVEAKEEIKVPAGTFKVFRVINTDPTTENTNWWSPELGIFIKPKSQRTEKHPMGPGVRETQLISYDIKR